MNITIHDALVALFTPTDDDGRDLPPNERDVMGWTVDGTPLVLDDRRLRPATDFANFTGIAHDTLRRVVAVMPAGGWRVTYTRADGSTWSQPLVGWGLLADGRVVPLDTDAGGMVMDLRDPLVGDRWRVDHPDIRLPDQADVDGASA